MSKEQARTSKKKEAFLEFHIRNGRYVARTCRAVGISRWTFYNWIKNDWLFFHQVKDLEYRTEFQKAMFAETWVKMRHKGISDVCRIIGISRWSYYQWVKKDMGFWSRINALSESERQRHNRYFMKKYPDWRPYKN